MRTPMPPARLTILVSAMVSAVPRQGGAVWATLQYVLGLRRLGHAVYLVEPIREASFEPERSTLAGSRNAAYFRQVMTDFGLTDTSALLASGTRDTVGVPYDRLLEVARRADVLLNVAGMLTDPALTQAVPLRVYLDLDPAFTQLWHTLQGIDMRFAGHNRFVTVGLAIGSPGCEVPTCGLPWITTLQPVALDHWPLADQVRHDAFTTVGNWRSYGSIEHAGAVYGQKAHSFRSLLALPGLSGRRFVLALSIHPDETADLDRLAENHWCLVDPEQQTATPGAYRRFVQGSRAELGVAKSGYVVSGCGWFSDRSVCYLASGRPVVAQETGFSRFLPTGEGLLPFETTDDAVHAIKAVDRDYARHSKAARALAEEHFSAPTVLTRLLQRIGALG